MGVGKGGSKIQVTDYRMSVHYAFCEGPVDRVNKLVIGDKDVKFETLNEEDELVPVTGNTVVTLSKKNLFGGPKSGGGIAGAVEVYMGGEDQVVSAALASRVERTPTTMPGYRLLFSLFCRGSGNDAGTGFKWGSNNPVLPTLKAEIVRYPHIAADVGDTWIEGTTTDFGDRRDANPAWLIYECNVNPNFGLGRSPDSMDLDSFVAAAAKLKAEALGLSLKWVRSQKMEDFIKEILNTIAGNLFFDLRIRKWRLTLIRNDYVLEDTRVVNTTRARLLEKSNQLWGETINEIQVSWTNPNSEQTETVTVQSDANIAIQNGEIISDNKSFIGIRRAPLAMRCGLRELQSVSAPLTRAKLDADQSFWDVVPGEVIRVDFPEDGLFMLPCRVMKIDLGGPSSEKVTLEVVEDVFSSPYYDIVAQAGLWEDPTAEPQPIELALLETAPYYMVASVFGDAIADALSFPQAYMAVILPPSGTDIRYIDFMTEDTDANGDNTYVERGSFDLQGSAKIAAGMAYATESTVVMTEFAGLLPESGTFIFIVDSIDPLKQEICVVTLRDGVNVTLKRGVLDTVPQVWPADVMVAILAPDTRVIDEEPKAVGDMINYKFLPVTSLGRLEEDDADVFSGALTDRPYLPLRPANVRINALAAVPAINLAASLDPIPVTWARRNRKTETVIVLGWTEADVTPETGQTTTVEVYNGVTLVIAKTGLAGTTVSFTRAEIGNPAASATRRFEIFSVRDGFESFARTKTVVTFT